MNWQVVAQALFGNAHDVCEDALFVHGSGQLDGQSIGVIGTCGHAPIGVELALRQARAVLDLIAHHPGRPLLLLIDTQGQQLRRRDELLGLNRAMAHLGMALDLARRQGHRVLALVYDQALSGGFLSSGLMADACYALPDAEIRVMRLPAMARVTKLPESRLRKLAQTHPVFAPGVDNYLAMGGVRGLWLPSLPGGLADALRAALADTAIHDQRAADGARRGGRMLAAPVIEQVLESAR